MKKEGNKPHFRNSAKRAAFDYLEDQLKAAQRKLQDNKTKISSLTSEQNELKKDIAGIQQVIQEFKK